MHTNQMSLQLTLMWGATEKEKQKAVGTEIPGWIFQRLQCDCNKDRNSSLAPRLPNKWEVKSQVCVQRQNTAQHRSLSIIHHP